MTTTPPTDSTPAPWAPKSPPSPVESKDRTMDPVHGNPTALSQGPREMDKARQPVIRRTPLPQVPWWDVGKPLTQSISWGAGVICDS